MELHQLRKKNTSSDWTHQHERANAVILSDWHIEALIKIRECQNQMNVTANSRKLYLWAMNRDYMGFGLGTSTYWKWLPWQAPFELACPACTVPYTRWCCASSRGLRMGIQKTSTFGGSRRIDSKTLRYICCMSCDHSLLSSGCKPLQAPINAI